MNTITKNILRLALPLALLLGVAMPAFSQSARFDDVAWKFTSGGNWPAGNATVTVCSSVSGIPCTTPVNVYQDAALTQPCTPATIGCLLTDNKGNYGWYAAGSTTYVITITGAGLTGYQKIWVAPVVSGGAFTATSVTSASANPAATGFLRLASGDTQCWRNNANNADLCLSKNASDVLLWPNAISAPSFTSTVTTGTAPLSIASTTVVPNLNAQFHGGLSAPASAILGLTDAQAPTNKTIDISANTLKNSTNTAGHYQRNNGTQYVDATIAGADLPATTSNCSGVQFAQGLNAGATPVCVTPPTFVASGASHAVGYVPDPGSSAGTTRFLREDATWVAAPGGVSEATWTFGPAIVVFNTGACPTSQTATTCQQIVFAKAHTLVRINYEVTQQASGCSPNVSVGVFDVTSSSVVSSVTVNQGTGFVDSGALSVAMTAGHTFGLGITTAGSGCTTFPSLAGLTAVIQ